MTSRRVALILAPLVVIVGWFALLAAWTKATCTCAVCGRTESQTRIAGLVVSRMLLYDGAEYAQRFPVEQHEHDWHVESCTRKLFGVYCSEQELAGWFRTLPRLADRAAADALVAEAGRLPPSERCRLMNEISSSVWLLDAQPGGIDKAFESWRARRR